MKKNHKINFIFKVLFFLNELNLIFPQALNNIIRIGEKNFRYFRFSFNSKGDMIIDISSRPSSTKRRFFGLKKNGKFYFKDQNDSDTPYFSLFINTTEREEERKHNYGRFRGESIFIKLGSQDSEKNGNEYLLGVTKLGDSYTEIYFFNESLVLYDPTSFIFGNITSSIFSIYKLPEDPNSNFHYIFSYIEDSSNFVIQTTYFNESEPKYYNNSYNAKFKCSNKKIVSCFYTVQLKYVCFFHKINNYLTIIVFGKNFTNRNETNNLEYEVVETEDEDDEDLFFKGIHLKEEIGAFIYFLSSTTQKPTLILKEIDEDIKNYSSFSDIILHKGNFQSNVYLNDIIKLNDFQICYTSTTDNNEEIKIVIFNLFHNDSQMEILYYSIKIKEYNYIELYKELRLALYNNFIALAFSHNIYENNKTSNEHFSSLVIFNYPNNSDNNLDLIEELYIRNKNIENDYCFNFKGKLEIENNIFDYIYKGTKIINIPDNIYLKNKGNRIYNNFTLLDDDCLTLSFPLNNTYYKVANYTIEYAYILTEQNKENIQDNIYYENSEIISKNEIQKEYRNYDYIGKASNFKIIIKYPLFTKCQNYSCNLCVDKRDMCVTCKYNFTFNKIRKICLPNHTKTESEVETPKCSNKEILDGDCNEKMTNEQIGQIYNLLREEIGNNTENKIIETKNVIIQISSIEEQKNNINPNISSINLGQCEDIIKRNEELSDNDELTIIKIDIKSNDLKSTYVQFEIYNPIESHFISLDICGNIQIVISTPVKLLDKTEYLFNNLRESGYNLFNISDKFYKDFCSTYTSENGTDLTLADRKNLIYDNNANAPMCQEGCIFEDYNSTIQQAKCKCKAQTQEIITDKNNIKFSKQLIIESFNFYNKIIISNFRLLKCFKLVFSLEGQKNNIGSYMMTIITIIFIILIIIFIIKGNSRINYYIHIILKQKITHREGIKRKSSFKIPNKEKLINKQKEEGKNRDNNIDKDKAKENSQDKRRINKQKTGIFKNYKKNEIKSKEQSKLQNNINNIKKNENNNFPPKRKKQKNQMDKGKRNPFKNSFENLSNSGKRMSLKPESMLNHDLRLSNTKDLLGNKRKEKKSFTKKADKKEFNILKNVKSISTKIISKRPQIQYKDAQNKKFNDEELNNLKYEDAIIIDKRTFFQYYFSLLKKKHLILFTFFPSEDYNLTTVKISLFLLSSSLYFTINGFFFTDETMSKINEDKGNFDIIFQIPQILYSTIISSVINIILKYLSLSEKQMLSIKKQNDYRKAEKEAKNIKKCINIKLALFFIISFLLMLFFWYYITSFCAVYHNTQIILIGDTLLSFGLSMIYPFGLNLLPGTFRITALRKKDKKCLYFISQCLALI